MARQKFPGISSDAYVSDLDRKALAALQKVPLLPTVVQKFHEMGWDRVMYCFNMATSVRCGPRQFPRLYAVMQECADILDMPEPELYVSSNPFPNAFAGGVERCYVTVRSSMIDALDDDQLFHLVGHELGHIKTGHMLYHNVGRLLFPLLEALGKRTLGISDAISFGLVLAFMEWSRQSEVSADRAGLLCSQDFRTSATANLMLCAGSTRMNDDTSVDAFLEQSRTYQDISGLDALGKLFVFLAHGATATHPMPVHRTQQLEKWFLGGEYDRVMSGQYAKKAG